MAKGKKNRNKNPLAKRPDETFVQWRSRVETAKQLARDKSVKILTPEAEASGMYDEEVVMHVETMTVAFAPRNRQASSLARLHDANQITDEQYSAALRIAHVAESIERNVSVRSALLQARVDNSGSGKDALVEHLFQVRAEMTYSRWRLRIPIPRRMILDMIIRDRELKVTARVFRMGWPRAKRMLIHALDLWIDIEERVWTQVDEEDLEAAHARLQTTI